ncbi:16463_t:CDS:2, partial [Funneliformis geosporum]
VTIKNDNNKFVISSFQTCSVDRLKNYITGEIDTARFDLYKNSVYLKNLIDRKDALFNYFDTINDNNTEVFQLKALSLNFLRNTSEITDEHIPKLNSCYFYDKEILALPLHSFTVLSLSYGKNKDFRKKDPLSDDTIEDEDSLADIIDDTENNDDDGNNNHSFQIRFRGLLHELSTPIKGKTTETNNDNESSEGSILQNLARLFQKAIKAKKCVTQAYQEEIHC